MPKPTQSSDAIMDLSRWAQKHPPEGAFVVHAAAEVRLRPHITLSVAVNRLKGEHGYGHSRVEHLAEQGVCAAEIDSRSFAQSLCAAIDEELTPRNLRDLANVFAAQLPPYRSRHCAAQAREAQEGKELLRFRLNKSTKRLVFDIDWQAPEVTFDGPDDGDYFCFTASNNYQVISRSRMDIHSERIWLLGGNNTPSAFRSGTMIFDNNEKRDRVYNAILQALREWATHNQGYCTLLPPEL